ncbi:Uncharacterised protein [Vibrio cholerae]|nr:Uncharacterised protein [Vibrio cholerae]CSI66684.1 Uncharacterised protein [Vibrio cholerae]CSI71713.1 Uncharacterised protein [Vibrio cholerae]
MRHHTVREFIHRWSHPLRLALAHRVNILRPLRYGFIQKLVEWDRLTEVHVTLAKIAQLTQRAQH